MAHIPDGILSVPVLAAGMVVSLGGIGLGLRSLTPERVPKAAVLSAVFFVASLVHLPAGFSSVHLILNGLMGVVLGAAAYPAIVVGLLLQAMLFGFGGLVVLGVNAMNMAVPALVVGIVFRVLWRPGCPRRTAVLGAAAGGLAVALTAIMVAASLGLSGREFLPATNLVLLSYVPVMVVEAVFTAAAMGLIARVKPELLS
ncbi:MAG: cobalt transporter CbiM [Rhodospirillaceae bacterium]|nr:cobalt transporter CbiM [Rhodospirillales bacterium]